jgi:hypothetical protein
MCIFQWVEDGGMGAGILNAEGAKDSQRAQKKTKGKKRKESQKI